eukprot:TRINITY_DN6652_c0_g1_i1.p1 TRINITY_DN6652_c0_g1~~TRINITY_DN6652_c0_g1_i1.p1  ORF type:complete len:318 (-),score=57.60 TRINITY_DN6652_c0_g1_i1:6-905(-)
MERIHVMVIGCGVMGAGIVSSFCSQQDYKVAVVESSQEQVTKAKLPKAVQVYSKISDCKEEPNLVVEAVTESFELKVQIFKQVEEAFSEKVIIASNTSTLPLDKMAQALKQPNRFLGCHYNHPPHVNPVVEITKINSTDPEYVDSLTKILEKCNKTVLVFSTPIDGFITNRLQHAMYREAYSLMQQGLATPHQIDAVAKNMFGPRMCVTGLLQQKDVSGLDTHTRSHREMVRLISNSEVCNPLLEAKFSNGEFGLKTGTGWFDWTKSKEGDENRVREEIDNKLLKLYHFLKAENISYEL